jgi:pilus assembly protein FimV
MHFGWPQLLVTIVALASGGEVAALGFGQVRSNVLLGQPLSLAIPVTLAEGETLGAECASAEVTAGESKLPASSVRVRITQGRDASESVLRINTTSVVDEPVLTVTVNAGCPTRLSRTLVLLADPPLVTTAAAPPETASLPTVAPPPTVAQTAPATAPSTAPAARVKRPAPPPRQTRAASTATTPRAAIAATAPAASAAARTGPSTAPRPITRAEPKPRLQLEAGQVNLSQASVLAAQEQASAARATASVAEAAASAAGERMRAMETEMTRVRAEAKAQTEALLQLRQQLALDRAQREQPSPWMIPLLGLAAVLAALVAWLGWRLRRQARAPRAADWWDRGPVSVSPPVAPSPVSEFAPSQLAKPFRMPSAPAPWSDSVQSRNSGFDSMISPPTVPAPTAVTIPPMPPAEPADDEASHAMSVDEQIDLEQQADFFIALGHDDAAIDLLMAHMRSTGGGSPLPFLKLLEIHRRRGQREDYERTRVRFNHRFNSVAPDWQSDPKSGRALEDYPLAIGRIQRAWPSPLDAMAELEALLFRRGGAAELFDLPAYQEVLFLYQMARDLHQAEGSGGAHDVDVLLPIGGRSAPMAAPEGTIMLRPEFNAGEPLALDLDLAGEEVKATTASSALDLELTEPEAPLAPAADDVWGDDPDVKRNDDTRR